ncbi:DUF4145 domain-containing protein [Leptospira selangorensis]|uniref:DUF4145 domain-containing protein n=1 Tax=Leptospira selangorensis TaxID=2484982 RepID=UPI0010835B47|nr:DUF4145 domain-containing protein [Leptospira selangorensis]TGK10132.1 DUF4145 domain-containing protein [Leptospira selangorensis]
MSEIKRIPCVQCGNVTKHTVKGEYKTEGFAEGPDISWKSEYFILECNGCEEVSFLKVSTNSENFTYNADGSIESIETIKVYPEREEGNLESKYFLNLPRQIEELFSETLESYNKENLILCAAGLRAIIEGVCADQKIKKGPVEEKDKNGQTITRQKGNLEGKINGLKQKDLLTEKQANILHQHRFLGNTALHRLQKPDKDKLKLAIEILEHILDAIYLIPKKATNLKRKK